MTVSAIQYIIFPVLLVLSVLPHIRTRRILPIFTMVGGNTLENCLCYQCYRSVIGVPF